MIVREEKVMIGLPWLTPCTSDRALHHVIHNNRGNLESMLFTSSYGYCYP